MSSQYHIDSDDGLISLQVNSRIDFDVLRDLAESVLNSDSYDHTLPLLVDLRGMRLRLTRQDAQSFSHFVIDRFRSRQGSVAVVIDDQMSGTLSAGIFWLACAVGSTEVFDDYDQALKWLIRREFTDARLASAGS